MNREAVFMHIPKTGGLSIRRMCKNNNIKVIRHDSRDPRNVSLAEYRRRNPNIFSFAVVRNPWDRLVSVYYFLRSGGIRPEDKQDADRFVNKYKNFNEFVLNAFQNDDILKQIHFRPQYLWISDNNKLIVDELGRFESLQSSVSDILEKMRKELNTTIIMASHDQRTYERAQRTLKLDRGVLSE